MLLFVSMYITSVIRPVIIIMAIVISEQITVPDMNLIWAYSDQLSN